MVYEAVGASGVAFDVIKHLGPNGVFIFTGVPGRKGPIEVDTDYIMQDVVLNNQVILGSVNAPPHSLPGSHPRSRHIRAKVAGCGSLADHRALSDRAGAAAACERRRRNQERDCGGVMNERIGSMFPFRCATAWCTGPVTRRSARLQTLHIANGDACNLSQISHQRAHRHSHGCAAAFSARTGQGMETMPIAATVGPRASDRDSRSGADSSDGTGAASSGQRRTRAVQDQKLRSSTGRRTNFRRQFVYIPEDTAHYLAECGVQTVGVDYLSVGGYETDSAETHRALLGAGIWIIEGLNLEHVEPGDYELICLPLKNRGKRRRTGTSSPAPTANEN